MVVVTSKQMLSHMITTQHGSQQEMVQYPQIVFYTVAMVQTGQILYQADSRPLPQVSQSLEIILPQLYNYGSHQAMVLPSKILYNTALMVQTGLTQTQVGL